MLYKNTQNKLNNRIQSREQTRNTERHIAMPNANAATLSIRGHRLKSTCSQAHGFAGQSFRQRYDSPSWRRWEEYILESSLVGSRTSVVVPDEQLTV